jgi:peptidoglycan/xylan/chitin deacetylase (PgdA/CDA1 family)
MKKVLLFFTAVSTLFFTSCQYESQKINSAAVALTNSTSDTSESNSVANNAPTNIDNIKVASANTILSRKQIPVLCYHQIRDWKVTDSKSSKDYIIPVATFKDQIKMLADSGYHTILPDQYYAYLNTGAPLPSKPIMLSFDDTEYNQYAVAAPTLKKYGYKAIYFIMTVSLGRPNYMTRAQVKDLSDAGNIIGSHTWDHHNVKKYQGKDWEIQLDKPTKTLEEITGKKIEYFAYPFGLWNPEGIPELKKRGMKAAYILSTKRDENDPLFTIRRIIASGYWTPRTLNNSIKNSF